MIRRMLAVSAAALVAGTAAILGLTAADRAYGRPGAAILLALAAVWLPTTAALAVVHTRRPR